MDDLDAMGAGNSRRNEEREEETRQDTERDTGAEASVSPEEIAAEEEATTAGHVIYQLLMGNQGSSLRHMYFLNNEEEEEEEEEDDDDDSRRRRRNSKSSNDSPANSEIIRWQRSLEKTKKVSDGVDRSSFSIMFCIASDVEQNESEERSCRGETEMYIVYLVFFSCRILWDLSTPLRLRKRRIKLKQSVYTLFNIHPSVLFPVVVL